MVPKNSMLLMFLLILVNGSAAQTDGIIKTKLELSSIREDMLESNLDTVTDVQQRFLAIHDVSWTNTFKTLIWPKELCQVVVFCDSVGAPSATEPPNTVEPSSTALPGSGAAGASDTTKNQKPKIYGEGLCKEEKLIYLAYESSIQKIDAQGKLGPKYYLPSPMLEFMPKPQATSVVQIAVSTDFDNVEKMKPADTFVELKLTGKMATLTSSPYCQIAFERDGLAVASFDTLQKDNIADDLKNVLHEYSYIDVQRKKTESVLNPKESSLANPKAVNKDTDAKKAALCDNFWTLPAYPRKRINTNYTDSTMLVQEYSYKFDETNKEFASVIVETNGLLKGGDCPWVKVCIGAAKVCSQPENVLELLFDYGMFVPTDSNSAHPFGASREHLQNIRLRFKKEKIGGKDVVILSMNYGLAGLQLQPLLSHTMIVTPNESNPDLKWPPGETKLTLVADRSCNARLLNDYGLLSSSGERRIEKQAMKINKCTVME